MGNEDALELIKVLEPEEWKLIPLIDIDRFYSIMENDVSKFIEKFIRPKYTPEEIKVRFPNKYKDLLKVADPKNIDIILKYRSYNYKIELIIGKELLYSKVRFIFP